MAVLHKIVISNNQVTVKSIKLSKKFCGSEIEALKSKTARKLLKN
jgi:hypothetical protein